MSRSKRHFAVLIVEDDAVLLDELAGVLEDEGHVVLRAGSAKEVDEQVSGQVPALAITDLELPDASGMDIVKKLRETLPECPILVMTATKSVSTAVAAMRLGAFHYLQKPVPLDALVAEVDAALEHGKVLRERARLKSALSAERGAGRIIGESPPIVALRALILDVAPTDSTCLITGETGTGKELVADALHFESERADGPLVKVNCAALSETLLESELFGHEKGAFTGAEKRRQGRFERADGGTLFLDEISEMGNHLQAKLLRVLQGEAFERVGGDEQLKPDVRVIAATNRDPDTAVEEGKIRRDLYYRLNVISVKVPPLRERHSDIGLLAEAFALKFAGEQDKAIAGLSDEAIAALEAHDWPGNVRELENCMERAVILAKDEHVAKGNLHMPPAEQDADYGVPADSLDLKDVEKRTILRALDVSGWNKVHAARKLGIYPSSLYKKMKRLGIPQSEPSS
jgi:two-component system response regulator HydG